MASSILRTEDEEQALVVQYCEEKHYPLWHTPNSTYTPSWKQKAKNKALGVSAGIPDLGVIVNNHLIFIEMKRLKASKTSEEQLAWIRRLTDANVPARVCRGFDEAKQFIDEIAKTSGGK